MRSTKGSEIDVELDGRALGVPHFTTQVGLSDLAAPYISDACTCRMTGMKDFSFPKARIV